MIKDVWSKISYIWFVVMLFIVGLFVGFDRVYGATLTEWSQKQVRIQTDKGGSSSWSSWQNVNGESSTTFSGSSLNYPVNAIAFRMKYNEGLSRENSYTFRFNWKPTPDSLGFINFYISNPDGEYEDITCNGPTRYSSGYYWSDCTFTPLEDYSSSDYVYLKINFHEAYLTELRVGLRAFDERKGVASIVTEQTNKIINQNTIINNSINNIDDTIKDSDVDSPNSSIEDMQNLLPTNGTITQLIALPINLYSKVLNSINGTCNQFDLGELYGTHLIMPCINLNNYLGNTLWSLIDLIISGVFVLTIAKKMIKAFEGFTSMKEGDVIND